MPSGEPNKYDPLSNIQFSWFYKPNLYENPSNKVQCIGVWG